MRSPKMILFDYGRTLACEPGWDSLRGNRELLKYAVKNVQGITAEEVQRTARMLDSRVQEVRALGLDVTGQAFNRLLYGSLGVEFSLNPAEQETVFWNAACPGDIMPGAAALLALLRDRGIPTGVISNLLWSGEALEKRLARLFPGHGFAFCLTSSDYLFRKPHKLLFETAVRQSGLLPEDIWFCGDNPRADVEGASAAGLYPVWYDSGTEDVRRQDPPSCRHLHIRHWNELMDILKNMPR